MNSLYPDGNAFECNHELSTAISKAFMILGYFEMTEDEQPDESIWNHPEKLEQWFEQIKERRANPGSEKVPNEWEGVDLEQNELTAEYRR